MALFADELSAFCVIALIRHAKADYRSRGCAETSNSVRSCQSKLLPQSESPPHAGVSRKTRFIFCVAVKPF